MSTSM
ncbi:Protein of unknown function [Propionibacterium freudenreichii]